MMMQQIAQALLELWNLIIEQKNKLVAELREFGDQSKLLSEIAEVDQDKDQVVIQMKNLFGSIDNTVLVAYQG
jgi:hypothetical protein